LVADVYALDIPYVRTGQKAWVSAFSGTGPRIEGKVTEIYPYDGTQSRVGRVKVTIPQSPASELFANVEIEAASEPLLSVPREAVMATGLQRYVFVEKGGNFAPREVTLGFQGDEDCQVASGLSAGETVVVGANFLLDADSKLVANFAAMESQNK
jgi:Cu(I)/Ag(I) efflux system membrane fusion protein